MPADSTAAPTVQVLGVPYDAHSSHLRGPADAPPAIRAALFGGSANWSNEWGDDLPPSSGAWVDRGDLELDNDDPASVEAAFAAITEAADAALAEGPLLTIGGDHSITWPVVRAVAAHHPSLTIVHFDAHPDTYDHLDGDRYSHASPFARIMEEGLADRLIQIGIRTMTPHQREQTERFGIEVLEARSWDGTVPAVGGPVYVSIDADALDPAYAPGVSHHEPGGLTTRSLLDALHQLRADGADVIAADVVEINPRRDLHDMTAMVGAKLVRELLGLLRA